MKIILVKLSINSNVMSSDNPQSISSAIQTTNGGIPTGRQDCSASNQSSWFDVANGSPPHRTFLIHPDDVLGELTHNHTALDESAAHEELKILSQVSLLGANYLIFEVSEQLIFSRVILSIRQTNRHNKKSG